MVNYDATTPVLLLVNCDPRMPPRKLYDQGSGTLYKRRRGAALESREGEAPRRGHEQGASTLAASFTMRLQE
ncbi:hypothetical protein E2C01_086968 [Portunus trituberculatus]|uniref:Uncharacterized protein n=1 Tax=Portunus trituberculatus TaxID=210409 RepID=A0A5B7JB54_PORTR|nr:hypothetical protein [Portunus trituberculatus]